MVFFSSSAAEAAVIHHCKINLFPALHYKLLRRECRLSLAFFSTDGPERPNEKFSFFFKKNKTKPNKLEKKNPHNNAVQDEQAG